MNNCKACVTLLAVAVAGAAIAAGCMARRVDTTVYAYDRGYVEGYQDGRSPSGAGAASRIRLVE